MKYYAIKKADRGVEVYDVTERIESLRKTKYYDEPTAKWTLAREMNADVFDEELAIALGLFDGKETNYNTTVHEKITANKFAPAEWQKERWTWETEYAIRKNNLRELAEIALATNDKAWFMEITDGFKMVFKR